MEQLVESLLRGSPSASPREAQPDSEAPSVSTTSLAPADRVLQQLQESGAIDRLVLAMEDELKASGELDYIKQLVTRSLEESELAWTPLTDRKRRRGELFAQKRVSSTRICAPWVEAAACRAEHKLGDMIMAEIATAVRALKPPASGPAAASTGTSDAASDPNWAATAAAAAATAAPALASAPSAFSMGELAPAESKGAQTGEGKERAEAESRPAVSGTETGAGRGQAEDGATQESTTANASSSPRESPPEGGGAQATPMEEEGEEQANSSSSSSSSSDESEGGKGGEARAPHKRDRLTRGGGEVGKTRGRRKRRKLA